MILHKLYAFTLVVWLALQTTCFGAMTITPNDKPREPLPELKQNALKLLTAVSHETVQFKLLENLVRARTVIADLMWGHDEAAARLVNRYAFGELRTLLQQIDAARTEEMSEAEKNEHNMSRFRLADLRREYVLMLAAHDPAAAVDALYVLQTKKIEEWEPLAERALDLKLEVATVIAAKDPNRAYALYKEEIAAQGISFKLVDSFDELHQKNSELTAKIFKDIFAIIKTAKIGEWADAGNVTKVVAQPNQSKIEFWQATFFLNATAALNRRAQRDKKLLPALTEAETRELAELLARAFLNTPNPGKNTINQAMTAITLYAPAQVQPIRSKVGAEGVRAIEGVMKSDAYYLLLREKNAEELTREADRTADLDQRDLLYSEAARKALKENEAEKAQAIATRIKKRGSYSMLIQQIETAVPLAVARRGNPVEVSKTLVRLKTKEERMAVLVELAAALAAKGDRETAKKMLDKTIDMLFTAKPDSKPDESSPESGLEFPAKFAAVLVVVAPDEAFTNIEVVIEGVNAEIKSHQSPDNGSVNAKELFYDSMERQGLRHVPNSIELLKNLAHADFERTVKLLDKFDLPEIRLLARLRLAQALLDAEAAEKEKKMREQAESEDSEH